MTDDQGDHKLVGSDDTFTLAHTCLALDGNQPQWATEINWIVSEVVLPQLDETSPIIPRAKPCSHD